MKNSPLETLSTRWLFFEKAKSANGKGPGIKRAAGERACSFGCGSGEGPAGGKAAAGQAFTLRWGGPGRPEEREPRAQLRLNPDYSSPHAVALASRVLGKVRQRRQQGSCSRQCRFRALDRHRRRGRAQRRALL